MGYFEEMKASVLKDTKKTFILLDKPKNFLKKIILNDHFAVVVTSFFLVVESLTRRRYEAMIFSVCIMILIRVSQINRKLK